MIMNLHCQACKICLEILSTQGSCRIKWDNAWYRNEAGTQQSIDFNLIVLRSSGNVCKSADLHAIPIRRSRIQQLHFSQTPGFRRHPFQYSCLENPMDRGAWRAAVHGVTKCQTRLMWLIRHAFTWVLQRTLSLRSPEFLYLLLTLLRLTLRGESLSSQSTTS